MDAMNCPSCASPFTAQGLDRRLGILTCDHCGAVIDLTRSSDRKAAAELDGGGTIERKVRGTVPMPDLFKISRGGGSLEIRWRRFQAQTIFILFFAAIWDGFLVLWYSIALSETMPDGVSFMTVVFPLGHVAAGVLVTYIGLVGLLNTTTVRVDGVSLTVSHSPLPAWPRANLRSHDIEQLYASRKVTRGKNGTTVTFQVMAVTRTNRAVKLLDNLSSLEQALWVEQEIEALLRIRDRAIDGEHRPNDSV